MRRSFLYVLIVSVVLSAIMGIVALLAGRFGDTEAKILLSTLCVAGASILSMACAAVLEKGRVRALALSGICASLAGFLLLLVEIWSMRTPEALWKSASTLVIAGTFCTHAALMHLARLSNRFRWVRLTTIGATALLALTLIALVWDEDILHEPWRIIGILAILGTAGTILTAVFQRMSRDERAAGATPSEAPRCPHCGEALPESFISSLR